MATRVASCLERTPFQFKEIQTRESLAAQRAQRGTEAAKSKANNSQSPPSLVIDAPVQLLNPVTTTADNDKIMAVSDTSDPNQPPSENLYQLAKTLQVSLENERDLIMLGGGMSASNSQDLLSTASPIFGYSTFEMVDDNLNSISSPDNEEDYEGLDQSLTEDFRHGITNINYDFDVSDHSAENSVAEGLKQPKRDREALTLDMLTSSKTLIEDSPKEHLPSPLLPTTVGISADNSGTVVDGGRAKEKKRVEPENLLIHK